MKPIEIVGGFIAIATALCAAGCTWVPLTSQGQSVRIVQEAEVAGCQKLGRTRSKTATRISLYARSDRKVQEELESLARNEAAEMGGDAIVPIGAPVEGRQSFEIYRCGTR